MPTQPRHGPTPGPGAAPRLRCRARFAAAPRRAGRCRRAAARHGSQRGLLGRDGRGIRAGRAARGIAARRVRDRPRVAAPARRRFRARVDQVREQREQAAQVLVERGREAGVDVAFLVWTGDPGDMIVVGRRGRARRHGHRGQSRPRRRRPPVPGQRVGARRPQRAVPGPGGPAAGGHDRSSTSTARAAEPASRRRPLLRVDALGVELLADQAQLLRRGRRRRREVGLILGSQAIVARTSSSVAPGCRKSSRISPSSSKCQMPEVRDDDRRAAPVPAARLADPLRLLGPAEVPGRGPEVDLARRTSARTGA